MGSTFTHKSHFWPYISYTDEEITSQSYLQACLKYLVLFDPSIYLKVMVLFAPATLQLILLLGSNAFLRQITHSSWFHLAERLHACSCLRVCPTLAEQCQTTCSATITQSLCTEVVFFKIPAGWHTSQPKFMRQVQAPSNVCGDIYHTTEISGGEKINPGRSLCLATPISASTVMYARPVTLANLKAAPCIIHLSSWGWERKAKGTSQPNPPFSLKPRKGKERERERKHFLANLWAPDTDLQVSVNYAI